MLYIPQLYDVARLSCLQGYHTRDIALSPARRRCRMSHLRGGFVAACCRYVKCVQSNTSVSEASSSNRIRSSSYGEARLVRAGGCSIASYVGVLFLTVLHHQADMRPLAASCGNFWPIVTSHDLSRPHQISRPVTTYALLPCPTPTNLVFGAPPPGVEV